MGIKGLLPLLKSIHEEINLSQFSGQTLAVDAYCWLHKGAFSCAYDLALGRPTKKYVDFFMQMVAMMQKFGVEPYIVFDGGPLPVKSSTEDGRSRRREDSLAKGKELIKEGKTSKAMEYFQQCVDITPSMALEVIKDLRKKGIKYVVAPYEADAQLAFLEQQGFVDGVITEDSDLLVFGCKKVIYKLNRAGNGILVSLDRLTSVTEISMQNWTLQDFRRMCILSGCDYLSNIPGMGLKTAHKLLRRCKTIERALNTIRLETSLIAPADYSKRFRIAEMTFLHQKVFDVANTCIVPLIPFEASEISSEEFDEISRCMGPDIDNETARRIAKGEVDPISKEELINFEVFDSQNSRSPLLDRKRHLNMFIAVKSEESESSQIIYGGPKLQLADPENIDPERPSIEPQTSRKQSSFFVNKTITLKKRNQPISDPRQTSILSFLSRVASSKSPTKGVKSGEPIDTKYFNKGILLDKSKPSSVFKTIQVSRFFKENILKMKSSTCQPTKEENSLTCSTTAAEPKTPKIPSLAVKFGQSVRHRFNRTLPRNDSTSSTNFSTENDSPERKRFRAE